MPNSSRLRLSTVFESKIRSNGLRVVFNYKQIVFFSDFHNTFHVATLPKKMDGYDGFSARCYGFFNDFWRDIKRF